MPVRVLSIADTHCGHEVGLNPPQWHTNRRDLRVWQQRLWRAFARTLEQVRPPVDVLFCLGDLVEGPQASWRGAELVTTSLVEQCEIAAAVIRMFEARHIYIARGTPIHVGEDENWENVIARAVGAEAAPVINVDVSRVRFNLRHRASRSTVLHGAGTPLARSWLNEAWAEIRRGGRAPAVALRGHTHRFAYIGMREWLAMSLPALGLGGGRLSQIYEGDLDWGVVLWHVDGGEYQWRALVQPTVMRYGRYRVQGA